jgi:hypothetical protein
MGHETGGKSDLIGLAGASAFHPGECSWFSCARLQVEILWQDKFGLQTKRLMQEHHAALFKLRRRSQLCRIIRQRRRTRF